MFEHSDEQRIFHHEGAIKFGKDKMAETFKKSESVHAVLQGKIRARSRAGIGTAEFALPDSWVEDIMKAHTGQESGGYGYYIVRVKS